MNTPRPLLPFLMAALVAIALPATAANYADDATAAARAGHAGYTIYVDVTFGARKDGAAKELNQAHVEFAALPPRLLKKVVAKRDSYERLMRGIVSQGMRLGAFRKRDPKLVTLAMLGAINWTIKWYRPEGRKSAAKIAREFADYLIKGLA